MPSWTATVATSPRKRTSPSLRASLATIRWTAGLPATKTDIEREIGALRSELRWFLGTLAALMLAMAASILAIAAKLFDIV